MSITEADITAGLEAAVAERGEDFVYPWQWKDGTVCMYLQPGADAPACLVGLALHKAGLSLDALVEFENRDAMEVVQEILSEDAWTFSNRILKAQIAQDSGSTWGEALAIFRDTDTTFAVNPPNPADLSNQAQEDQS